MRARNYLAAAAIAALSVTSFVAAGATAASAAVTPHAAIQRPPSATILGVFAAYVITPVSLVADAYVTAGEELTTGGRAYVVQTAAFDGRKTTFTVAPALPVSDTGHQVTFSRLS